MLDNPLHFSPICDNESQDVQVRKGLFLWKTFRHTEHSGPGFASTSMALSNNIRNRRADGNCPTIEKTFVCVLGWRGLRALGSRVSLPCVDLLFDILLTGCTGCANREGWRSSHPVVVVVVRGVAFTWTGCANAITASGCTTRADSRGAAPPNSRIRLRAVAGHSRSQCSSVSGAPWQCGQVAEESASTMFRYAASLWCSML